MRDNIEKAVRWGEMGDHKPRLREDDIGCDRCKRLVAPRTWKALMKQPCVEVAKEVTFEDVIKEKKLDGKRMERDKTRREAEKQQGSSSSREE